ncbi:major facilitator superfamily domain-containing protein 6-like isoform X4 [Daphnia pulex]|uniref:major facilitator superfamily domain-containing protein 6-like isoform X4 n=1 Tax=Daphnia pulex TaxID=6669 RepID=UPI001EDE7048|nr:major facilitator superfamily domain-containing protein 6-like isoform X4 [Daphnia pulex]
MLDVKINRKLLPIKSHYFLFNAGTAPLMPYIPTYAKQLGIPSSGVGIMYAIFPFVGLIAKPSFGALADKFKKGKLIFILSIIFTAIFFGCIAFIPAHTTDAFMDLECNSGETRLKTCNVTDGCALDKIEMEFQGKEIMECKLVCYDPNYSFLEQICNDGNISESCFSNQTHIEMTTYSNISDSTFEQTCLYFPVKHIYFNGTDIENPQCNGASGIKCSVDCNSSTVMDYIQNAIIEQIAEPYYKTIQFQLLFFLMAGAWAAQAVVVCLSDAICFNLLGDKPHNYGAQRLWGAVGWGLMAIIAGYLIDLASAGQLQKDYTPSFYLVVIILAINAVSVIKIKVDYHQEPYQIKKILILFKNVRVVLFLFSCITFGICIGIVWQFQLWFLEDLASAQGCDSLQWIKLLQGLAMGVQCFLGEAPFLFLSGRILKKFGHVHTMTMILLVMGIRLLAYSYLVNPWYTLPIDLLNGLTLGVYWSTMASYANLIAPPEATSTLQGIFGALFEGIGTSIGSLFGGFIYESYGGAIMFRSFGIYALVYGAIYSLSHFAMDFNKRKSSDTKHFSNGGRVLSNYGSLVTGNTHSN